MQNRRIIDGLLRSAGAEPAPTLESNSMIVLFAHVRTGKWASIMPAKLAETLGLTESVRAIPIVEPAVTHAVGLIVANREPNTPLGPRARCRGTPTCETARAARHRAPLFDGGVSDHSESRSVDQKTASWSRLGTSC